jgi:hypothetical protein
MTIPFVTPVIGTRAAIAHLARDIQYRSLEAHGVLVEDGLREPLADVRMDGLNRAVDDFSVRARAVPGVQRQGHARVLRGFRTEGLAEQFVQ